MLESLKDVNIDYYLELSKKETNLLKENRSLLTENPKEFKFLLDEVEVLFTRF